MKQYLVYWQWHHGGKPAPTLIEAETKGEARLELLRRKPQGTKVLDCVETDPSKWPVCNCGRWFVSDKHSKDCPAFGNVEGTWIVPTRPKGAQEGLVVPREGLS